MSILLLRVLQLIILIGGTIFGNPKTDLLLGAVLLELVWQTERLNNKDKTNQ